MSSANANDDDIIDFPKIQKLDSPAHPRRKSSVGNIDLGDTTVPALSTMPLDPRLERESRHRLRVLSASSANMPVVVEASSASEPSSSSQSAAEDDDDNIDSGTADTEVSSSSLQSSKPGLGARKRKPQKSPAATTSGHHPRLTTISPASPALQIWYRIRELAYRNTWLTPLVILALMASAYLVHPSPSNPLHMFLRLSYQRFDADGSPLDLYGKGYRDFAFVATGIVFFMFFREFCMQVILQPLAVNVFGLHRRSKISRFLEQTYAIVYFSISASFGFYIMYHNKDGLWYYNTRAFYEHYPHKAHDGLFKAFYLLQAAFWAQQSIILMLQVEKPRKDFRELVFHHVVTIALIFCSYRFHFAMMGIAVFITMDTSDIFLSLSKTLNYLDSKYTPAMFVLFIAVWVYLRHYLNIVILWSVLTQFRTVGPYQLSFPDQQYKCWISQIITFFLILALQLVNLYWLFLIFRILYRYVVGGVQKDERSDDEDEEEELQDDLQDKNDELLQAEDQEKRQRILEAVAISKQAKQVKSE